MKSLGRQRGGAAILILLAVLALGGTYYLVSGVNAMSTQRKASVQSQNAALLLRAKQALIGYVATQANRAGENDPGALPCPEAPGYFTSTTQDGQAAANCTLPNVGRYPWRTIGTDKLVDAAGEPLWYVVSPGWARTGSNTNINSNSVGQLTIDASAGTDGNTVVALIIAPGPAINVIATAGCSAWSQARPNSGVPDWRNYLECENATTPADASFVTTGPDGSFNDQVIRVTKAEVMPVIEAAIANRIEREIAPVLKTMYTGTKWNASSGQTTFPFAAPFANPTTSAYQGNAGTAQGLLPFSYSPTCTPVGDARCTTSSFHSWATPAVAKTSGSGSLWIGPDCSVSGAYVTCTGYYQNNSLTASFDDRLANMANALRDFPLANHTVRVWTTLYDGWSWDSWVEVTGSVTLSRRFNSDGSLSFRVSNVPLRWSWGTSYGYYYIEAQRPVPTDRALLDSTDPTTGWFVRNEWYRLVYYAIAPNYAPGGSLSCTTGSSCLTVTNLAPAGAQRSLLILAGRSINGTARPNSTLPNYLEGGNQTNNYVKKAVSNASSYNDRFVVVDSN